MALVDCSTCGRKTGAGAFCEKCGAELPVGPAGPIEPAGRAAGPGAGLDALAGESTLDAGPCAPEAAGAPVAGFRSCGFLHVEHDQSRVFVVGQTLNFRFALTPLVDGLADVFVAIVFEGRGRKVEVKRLGWIPRCGERRELRNINFSAPEAGSVGFSFYFGFRKDGVEVVFEADGEHKVWPAHADAREVIRNLEINIQNSGHATDFNLSGIREQLRPDETAADLIDRLHRERPAWAALQLYGSTWRPPRSVRRDPARPVPVVLGGLPPPQARLDRLTLRTDGRRVHLVTGDAVRLGKNRGNDIVTRLFDGDKAPAALNARISRHHCVIGREGALCHVADRGDYPVEGSRPSAYGVFVDGRRVPASGRAGLDGNAKRRLTLAGAECGIPGVFGLEVEPWRCDPAMGRACRRACGAGSPGSLVLRRRDAIPETYIVLWECFALGEADPDFDGIVVWREGGGYGYATAEAEGWLEPGLAIEALQCEVRAEPWKQYGL